MELELEIERLKQRVTKLEQAQGRTWRSLGLGAAMALLIGLVALPPHMIRGAVAAGAVILSLRFWPHIAEVLPWRLQKPYRQEADSDFTFP